MTSTKLRKIGVLCHDCNAERPANRTRCDACAEKHRARERRRDRWQRTKHRIPADWFI